MDLATLEITAEEATARLAEYQQMLADERTAEDDAVLAAYRAAKRGLPIIRLAEAFRIAGRFPDRQGNPGVGLPRLAIVRADSMGGDCVVSHEGRDWLFFDAQDAPAWSMRDINRGATVNRRSVRIHGGADGVSGYRTAGRTTVPTIPPRHRPNSRRLHLFHILWEVEAWTPEPPIDPALVRHIRGDLWSVMAVWDLTAIERAVLAQRR